MMGMMKHFCKDLECNMENQGDKLTITLKGDKEKIAQVEKKLKALQELCCKDGENCCC